MAIDPIRNAADLAATQAAAPARSTRAVPVNEEIGTPSVSISGEDIESVVQELRKYVEPVAQDLQFSIDKDTGRTIVKLIDSNTKEVLRQIPSEELIAISKALGRSSGVLLERKA